MKKTLAMLVALALIVALVPTFAMAESQVLTVATWDATTTPYLDATKAAFEASHPGVTIEYVDVSSQDYTLKTQAMLAGGDTTDVFDVKELSNCEMWSQAGYIEPLDGYINDNAYDTTKYAGVESCYADENGVMYALPYRSDFWVLFYNKDLFDAAKVEYPTGDMTWDEYADLARKLTSGTEGVDKIYGTHYHTWLSDVANWAVCDGVNTLADGEYSDLKYFYELVLGLEDEGVCMAFPEVRAANLHYRGAFDAGNIAMMPMGYWFVSTLIGDIQAGEARLENFGITSVPHLEGVAAGSSFGSPTGCAINVNSNQKDLAWEFISWRCSEEGAKAIAATGTRPAYVSEEVANAMSAVEGFPSDEGSKAALIPTAVELEWPTGKGVAEIKTAINEEHTNIMTRSISVDEGIEAMNERAQEILAQ